MRKGRLTPKQTLFVQEYLVDLNGTAAAIRAGYSAKTAHVQAARLLTNVKVARAIEEAFQERLRRIELTQDAVVKRLVAKAFTDIDAFVTWTDNKITITNLDQVPKESLAALSEVSETLHGLRIRMSDQMPALTLLAKHLGMLPRPGSREEPIQHEVTVKEKDIDVSHLTDEQLSQLRATIAAILDAQRIARGDPGPGT